MLGCNSVDLASKIAGSGGKNRYVINMGAADGKSFSDPCYPLFSAGYPGVAIDRIDSPILRKNLPQDNVTILTETVLRPQNVASILKKAGCPKRPLMLKVDVDGIDGDLLISTLNARFLPDFFQIEIQPEFPPGIHFSVKYHRLFEAKNGWGGFYGLSITAAEKVARAYGYAPVFWDLETKATHDVIFARNRIVRDCNLETIDTAKAYQQEGCRQFHFSQVGIDSRKWQNRSDWDVLLREIFDACMFASQASFGVRLPFELSLDWEVIKKIEKNS